MAVIIVVLSNFYCSMPPSALYSADGDETDDDVESGVEALEEPWQDASIIPRPPSAPLGATLSNMHQGQEQLQQLSFKCLLYNHKYVIFLNFTL